MDVNKAVDQLETAIKSYDVQTALQIDEELGKYQNILAQGLMNLPREHSDGMNFYFKDWIMSRTNEAIAIGLMFGSRYFEPFWDAVMLGVGLFMFAAPLLNRDNWNFHKFKLEDMSRMKKERIASGHFRLELQYILQTRAKHAKTIDQMTADSGKGKSDPIRNIIEKALMIQIPEKPDENQKDT